MELTGMKAIVTGGHNGNLGPIWREILLIKGCKVESLDLPDCDITNKNEVLAHAANLKYMGFVPDIIINNAAIDPKPLGNAGIHDRFDEILKVNLSGVNNVIEAFAEDMKKKGGVIINIGSMLGFVSADPRNYQEGFMKPYGYGTSKAGLLGLTRNVGVYYGKWGIRCVMLALGPVDSEKWHPEFREKLVQTMPLNRFISHEDLKAGLMFCIQSPNFNARELLIDGGYSAR